MPKVKDPISSHRQSLSTEISLSSRTPLWVEKAVKSACLFVIIALPVLQAFRSLDMTDTGFVATNQRFLFSDPAHVSFWFHLWLTNILGGIVDFFFGRYGLLPMKLASALIFWGSIAAVFKLYRSSVQKSFIWLGIALTMVFNFADKINIIHYNNLSALFYACGAWFLIEAALSGRAKYYLFAGFILSLNTFVRLPNAIGIGLIAVIPILNFLAPDKDTPLSFNIRSLAAYMTGIILALVAAAVTMVLLGHHELFLKSLGELSTISTASASHYKKSKVIMRPLVDTLFAFLYGGGAIVLVSLLSVCAGRIRNFRMRIAVLSAMSAICLVVLFTFFSGSVFGRNYSRTIAGAGYLSTITIIFFFTTPRDSRFRAAAAMASSAVFLLGVGSDTGIKVSSYLIPLIAPAVLSLFYRLGTSLSDGKGARIFASSAMVLAFILSPLSIFGFANGIYRDSPVMARMVNHPQLRGIFTLPERADVLEQALPVIAKYAPPGSTLLAYDSICLVHFATRTKPYLDNPWPVQYMPDELESILKIKEKSEPLPVVVYAKSNPRSYLWPGNKNLPEFSESVQSFLMRNGYHIVWENSALEILVPGKK